MTDVLWAETRRPAPDLAPPPAGPRRHRRWVPILACAVLLGAAVGYLLTNATQANDRYNTALRSLGVTHATSGVVSGELAKARTDLRLVTQQVGSDTTALSQDTSQLQGAQSALSAAQAHMAQQTSLLNSLHTCLGGVEQALNALAVGSQANAEGALHSVAASCSAAVDASG